MLKRHVSTTSRKIQLRQKLSPFLMKVHPDRFVHESKKHIREQNERTMQELNGLLDYVEKKCNGMAVSKPDFVHSTSMKLKFYIEFTETPKLIHCTIKMPNYLGQNQAPWRQYAHECVGELLKVVDIQQEEFVSVQETRRISIGNSNRAQSQQNRRQKSLFYNLLKKEYDVVVPISTGYEDIHVSRHKVLCDILLERVMYDPLLNAEARKTAFRLLGNTLLRNFYVLGMHSLVWNKVVMILAASGQPDVWFNPDGCAITIPVDLDEETMVDFLIKQAEALEHRYR